MKDNENELGFLNKMQNTQTPMKEKDKIIKILQKRESDAFSDGYHNYEKERIGNAINTINELVPHELFETLYKEDTEKRCKNCEHKPKESHGICKEENCEKPATKDYNGHNHWVCDYHYKTLVILKLFK